MGRDIIVDFEDHIDMIELGGVVGADAQAKFDALSIHDVMDGDVASVEIAYGPHMIVLNDTSSELISISDFDFG